MFTVCNFISIFFVRNFIIRFYIFVFYQLSITGSIHLCDLMLSHNVLPQHSLRARFKFTLITCIIPSSVSHFFSDFVQVWYSIIILPITSLWLKLKLSLPIERWKMIFWLDIASVWQNSRHLYIVLSIFTDKGNLPHFLFFIFI